MKKNVLSSPSKRICPLIKITVSGKNAMKLSFESGPEFLKPAYHRLPAQEKIR
jgi:hypothetical protein